MRKLALLLLALLSAYAAYPYWSLYRLGEALEVGNEGALKQHVDWPAVRRGLKEDLSGIVSREAGRAIASGDGEAALGGLLASAIGNALLDPLIDALVTPEGLAAMILRAAPGRAGRLPIAGPVRRPVTTILCGSVCRSRSSLGPPPSRRSSRPTAATMLSAFCS